MPATARTESLRRVAKIMATRSYLEDAILGIAELTGRYLLPTFFYSSSSGFQGQFLCRHFLCSIVSTLSCDMVNLRWTDFASPSLEAEERMRPQEIVSAVPEDQHMCKHLPCANLRFRVTGKVSLKTDFLLVFYNGTSRARIMATMFTTCA